MMPAKYQGQSDLCDIVRLQAQVSNLIIIKAHVTRRQIGWWQFFRLVEDPDCSGNRSWVANLNKFGIISRVWANADLWVRLPLPKALFKFLEALLSLDACLWKGL